MNSMVMKSEVVNSGGDERRVMDGVVMNVAVMDGTLTVQVPAISLATFHISFFSESNKALVQTTFIL